MIRKLLLCSGIYGNREALNWLTAAAEKRRPDAVLFAGGITEPSVREGDCNTPWSLTAAESRFVEEFFTTLGGLNIFTAVIPGPKGEPLEEFLRLAMQAEIAHPTIHSAHATLVEQSGVAVSGIGGILADSTLLGMESYSRTTAEYFLRSLWKAKQPRKVVLLAAPPTGKLGGLDGLPLVGELIDSFHPDLCVVAGSSERRGTEHSGHTLIVNPGCLTDGWAAWVDWNRSAHTEAEVVNLRAMATPTGIGPEHAALPHGH
jgi:Icc-related predicted phosphoesterase